MIRSILIFVYIAVVLLVSGLAQAGELALIKDIQFDQDNYLLHIQGKFSNSCQSAPKPVLLNKISSATEQTAYIGVRVEKLEGMICNQVISGQYDLVFDIRTLDLASQKDLVLKFKNAEKPSVSSLSTRIEHKVYGLQFAASYTIGTLVEIPTLGASGEPAYAVVSDDRTTVSYVQSLIDLSDYVNRHVRVAGVFVGHTIAPELDAVDLGFGSKTGDMPEKIFATEISLIPLQ